MIYITGDTHGDIEKESLKKAKKLKKTDVLIICGDFGFVWTGDKQEKKHLNYLSKQKATILFLDGCHENFDLLETYPLVPFGGSLARQIQEGIYQLLRGHVYEIQGKSVFTMGGGQSEDVDIRMDNDTWNPKEMPSKQEMETGIKSLKSVGCKVDFILSHQAPASIKNFIDMDNRFASTPLNTYLEKVKEFTTFSRWIFGHYHMDKPITPTFSCVFDDVICLEEKK